MPDALPIGGPAPVDAPPAPRGVEWIDVETAARRSGWDPRHVRRLAGEEWFARGLARQDGGRWLVREDAHPKLARVRAAADLSFDLRQLPAEQRRELQTRVDVLEGWRAAKAAAIAAGRTERAATAEYLRTVELVHGLRISRRTLYAWQQLYTRDGVAGLVDGRRQAKRRGGGGGDDGPGADDDPFFAEFRTLWLSPNRPTVSQCHLAASRVAQLQGFPARSYTQCVRYKNSIPKPVVAKLRGGGKAYTDDAEPFIERDYSTLESNEQWCGDHHQFDVMVRAPGGRHVGPWLTAWMDMRSRKIVGWAIYATDPNSDTILSTFRAAALDYGVPGLVYVDNGRDYLAEALAGRTRRQRFARKPAGGAGGAVPDVSRGVFRQLGVEMVNCQPYHGQSKPIERFFRTVEDRFGRTFRTYCGNSAANKPEGLADRLRGGDAPELADFADAFGRWLAADYHGRAHSGDGLGGKTPDCVYAECLRSKRTAPAELLDLLMQRRSRPVKVTQNGVNWHGVRYGQHEPALVIERLGQQVCLGVDDRDLSKVSVWTPEDVFVCYAPSNRRLPANASAEDLREAISRKRQHNRTLRAYQEQRPRMAADLTELVIDAAAERAKSAPPADPALPPPSIVPLRAACEDQLPALRAALDAANLRKAAGAEALSGPDIHRQLAAAFEADHAEEAARQAAEPDVFAILARAVRNRGEEEADHV